MKSIAVIIVCFVSFFLNGQTVYYVNANNGNDINDGLSWDSSFLTLQSALEQVNAGDEIWMTSGVYYPTAPPENLSGTPTLTDRDNTFQLRSGVTIYGGFSGVETMVSQRNIEVNPTVLSGNIGDSEVATDNVYHVIISVNNTINTNVDGVIIEQGYADGTGSIVVEGETLSRNYGGGITIRLSSLNMNEVLLRSNLASTGGSVYLSNPNKIDIIKSRFSNNAATNSAGLYSSGSNGSDSEINVINVIFDGNTATSWRGAIGLDYAFASEVNIINSLFFGNHAFSAAAIGTSESPINIENCTFTLNSSTTYEFGSTYNHSAETIMSSNTMTNTVFYNNNTLYDIEASGDLGGATSRIVVSHSYWESLDNYVNGGIFNAPPNSGALTTDPFMDSSDPDGDDDILGTPDDGLVPSPVINNLGLLTDNTPNNDITGSDRLVGTIDVGAYENQVLDIENYKLSKFELYPNPVDDYLNIHRTAMINPETDFEIINSLGQSIYKGKLSKDLKEFDVSNLRPGFYFVSISINSQKEILKFIKR